MSDFVAFGGNTPTGIRIGFYDNPGNEPTGRYRVFFQQIQNAMGPHVSEFAAGNECWGGQAAGYESRHGVEIEAETGNVARYWSQLKGLTNFW